MIVADFSPQKKISRANNLLPVKIMVGLPFCSTGFFLFLAARRQEISLRADGFVMT
jgi:hypothetical protein